MNGDKFPKLSEPDDDEVNLGSILNSAHPKSFDYGGIISRGLDKDSKRAKSNDENEEIDDEEDTKTDQKKRFPILLKEIFPKTLDKREKYKTMTDEMLDDFGVQSDMPEEKLVLDKKDNPAKDTEATSYAVDSSIDGQDFQAETTDRTELEAAPRYEPKTIDETENQQQAEVTEHEADMSKELSQKNVAENVVQPVEQLPQEQPPRVAPPIIYAPGISDNFSYQAKEQKPAYSNDQPKIIERPDPTGATLAFMGAELLSRRRDRKIRKKIDEVSKSTDRHIKEIEQSIDQATNSTEPESLDKIIERRIKRDFNANSIDKRIVPEVVEQPEPATTELPAYNMSADNELSARQPQENQQIDNEISAPEEITSSDAGQQKNDFESEAIPENRKVYGIPVSPELNLAKETDYSEEHQIDNGLASPEKLNRRGSRLNTGHGSFGLSQSMITTEVDFPELKPHIKNSQSINYKTLSPGYKQSMQVGSGAGFIILIIVILLFIVR